MGHTPSSKAEDNVARIACPGTESSLIYEPLGFELVRIREYIGIA